MIGPTSSWISSPNIESSCGGRPTTVKGQIASRAMIDLLHDQHGKIVGQAVVAQVVAEGAFGQLPGRVDVAADAEIGVGMDREAFALRSGHRHAAAAQHAGEGQFADAFGQRHHGGQGHRRRAADEDVHPERLFSDSSAAAWCTPMPRWIW